MWGLVATFARTCLLSLWSATEAGHERVIPIPESNVVVGELVYGVCVVTAWWRHASAIHGGHVDEYSLRLAHAPRGRAYLWVWDLGG